MSRKIGAGLVLQASRPPHEFALLSQVLLIWLIAVAGLSTETRLHASEVVGWGGNHYGQTNVPGELGNVVAIAAGDIHSLALTSDGRVVGWGDNSHGQTNIPAGLSNAAAIAAGDFHSLALTAEGRVVGWGENGFGQATIPSGLSNVVAIAAGARHSLALTADGRVAGWGLFYNGSISVPLDIPNGLNDVTAIASGSDFSLALTAKGRVVGWGRNNYGQANIPSGLSNVVSIAAGGDNCVALTDEGRVVEWGRNRYYGQTNNLTGLSNVVAIAAGTTYFLGLNAAGRVVILGNASYAITNITGRLSNVVAIAAGREHGLAIKSDGTPAITMHPANQSVSAGDTMAFRVLAAGTAPLSYQWQKGGGSLADGGKVSGAASATLTLTDVQLSDLGGYAVVVANASGSATSSVANLRFNQTITFADALDKMDYEVPFALTATASSGLQVSYSSDNPTVATVSGNMVTIVERGTAQVAAMQSGDAVYGPAPPVTRTLSVTSEVVGWGNNFYGQTDIPSGLSNVVAIAAGDSHSLALTLDGQVAGWGGRYNYGQTNIPSGLSNVVAVAAGYYLSLALTAEGRVVGWGLDSDGQKDFLSGLSNVVAIAAGGDHSLALTAEGRVVGWGDNSYGQTNIPSGLCDVVAIAAGSSHSLALTAEGQVVGWGNNYYGQTNIPSGLSNVVAVAAGNSHSLATRNGGAPVITGQPRSRTEIAGRTVAFQAWAAGMPPLRYQWQKDGSNLPGETNAGLRVTGITPSDGGSYTAIVSNSTGQSVTSAVATLTVGYLLNTASSFGGSVIRDPDLASYAPDSLVTLTATPSVGFGFIRWTGEASGSINPLAVILDTNRTVTAVFASTALTLTSQGVGTATKLPDQTNYAVGDEVVLSATAGRWYEFSGWSGGATNNPRRVTIGEFNDYTAIFRPTTALETVTIGGVSRTAPVGMPAVQVASKFIVAETVSARGSAQIKLSTTFPGGTLLYTLDGTAPSLAASLYTGQFTVAKTCVVRAIAFKSDFSSAVEADPVTVVILPTLTGTTAGGGSVAIQPPSGAYFSNSIALITATPSAGWEFLQWLGDAEGTNLTASLTMTRNKRVIAVFGTSLNTTIAGNGSLVVDPVAARYPYGANVRLTAVPWESNYFAFWANAGLGKTNNPLIFSVKGANTTVTAAFASLSGSGTNALSVIPDGRGLVTVTPPWNRFPLNTNVVLRAIPDAGQTFLGWGGDASGTANPLIVTMASNTVVAANFTSLPRLQGEGFQELLSQEGFRLTLTGDWGLAYRIDHSTNLTEWSPLTTLTNTFGTVQFTDGAGTNSPRRIYRAVTPP